MLRDKKYSSILQGEFKQSLISSNLILDGAVVSLAQGIWHSKDSTDVKVPDKPQKTIKPLNGFQQISNIFLI